MPPEAKVRLVVLASAISSGKVLAGMLGWTIRINRPLCHHGDGGEVLGGCRRAASRGSPGFW